MAFRAKVSRRLMARALCGDVTLEVAELGDVVFHLGLAMELVPVPENPQMPGPVPTVVDVAIQRLRGT